MERSGNQIDGLKGMHEESVTWKSDLKFCLDEFNFFDKLLNSYQYVPDNKEDFDLRNDLVRDFEDLRICTDQISACVLEHMNQLGGLYDKGTLATEEHYCKEHEDVKQQVREFKLRFKAFKTKLFALADHILEGKKPGGTNI